MLSLSSRQLVNFVFSLSICLTIGLMNLLGQVEAQTGDACIASLTSLLDDPKQAVNAPYFNSATGHFNLAYFYANRYNNAIWDSYPYEVMGQYDMCKMPEYYAPGDGLSTNYCVVNVNFVSTGAMCLPSACTQEVLEENHAHVPFLRQISALRYRLGAELVEACATVATMGPSPECLRLQSTNEYLENVYELMVLFNSGGAVEFNCNTYETLEAKTSNKVMLGIFFFFVILCAFATLWHIFMGSDELLRISPNLTPRNKNLKLGDLPVSDSNSNNKNEGSSSASASASASATTTTKSTTNIDQQQQQQQQSQQQLSQKSAPAPAKVDTTNLPVYLSAFDVITNTKEIFSIHVRPGEFSCFDGMRGLSCFWVIIYHVILWQHTFYANPDALLPNEDQEKAGFLGKWWSMPFFSFSGTLCVDTFFFISAFLATFLLIKKLDKEQRPAYKWIPLTYFHRFLRITPAYMFAMFFNWQIAPLLAYGPLAANVWKNNIGQCQYQWWTHLLYINTLYFPHTGDDNGTRICFGHTWYLADDMLFFYFVPIVCLLYSFSSSPIWAHRLSATTKKIAHIGSYVFVLAIIFSSLGLAASEAYERKWTTNSWDMESVNYTRMEEGEPYGGFEAPWIRIPTYFIGILFGLIWTDRKFILKQRQAEMESELKQSQAKDQELIATSGLIIPINDNNNNGVLDNSSSNTSRKTTTMATTTILKPTMSTLMKKQAIKDYKYYTPVQRTLILFAGLGILALVMYGPATGTVATEPCIPGMLTPTCGADWDRLTRVMLATLARPAWAVGLALICVLCWNGQGGLINSFLSAPIWAPISFLTYTAYLTHYTVLTYYMSVVTERVYFTGFTFTLQFIGLSVFSFVTALVLSLMIEKPFMKIQREYLEKRPVSKSTKTNSNSISQTNEEKSQISGLNIKVTTDGQSSK
jgi:peptidoglycan/LPS O-acetylase OafA/YrhL